MMRVRVSPSETYPLESLFIFAFLITYARHALPHYEGER